MLIGTYLDNDETLLNSVKKTLARLEGTWGICVISKDHPDQMIAARNGSPLVIGIGENRTFVASETSAFSRHTNQFISLADGKNFFFSWFFFLITVFFFEQAKLQPLKQMEPILIDHELNMLMSKKLNYRQHLIPIGRQKKLPNNRNHWHEQFIMVDGWM